jgi:hypothetical protein
VRRHPPRWLTSGANRAPARCRSPRCGRAHELL